MLRQRTDRRQWLWRLAFRAENLSNHARRVMKKKNIKGRDLKRALGNDFHVQVICILQGSIKTSHIRDADTN